MFINKNVFVNCPYDDKYILLRPIVFTIKLLGFNPRLAMESADSGMMRITRICNLIKNSRYAIHDLSRLRANRSGEPFRLNMPFELGLDFGCREFGTGQLKRKKSLVLEKDKYSMKEALSDLSNSDVCSHNNEPEKAVLHVRNWLVQEAGAEGPSGTAIWFAYNDFNTDLYKKLYCSGFRKVDVVSLPLLELLKYMTEWIKRNILGKDRPYS
ncbi:MAG: hypothetical protein ABII64_02290 [Elusimicrobiota bacterium]